MPVRCACSEHNSSPFALIWTTVSPLLGERERPNLFVSRRLRADAAICALGIHELGKHFSEGPYRHIRRIGTLRNGELVDDPEPCSVALSAGDLTGHAAIRNSS